ASLRFRFEQSTQNGARDHIRRTALPRAAHRPIEKCLEHRTVASRSLRREVAEDLFALGRCLLDARRGNRPRFDQAHVYAPGVELQPQGFTQSCEGTLAAALYTGERHCDSITHRAQVHDAPGRDPDEGQECLRYSDLPKYIDLELPPKVLHRNVFEGSGIAETRIVHESVKARPTGQSTD